MNISTSESDAGKPDTRKSGASEDKEMRKIGGAFADGLTLIRLLLTPVVMYVIIFMDWPDLGPAILASVLFIIAALTDIFDDIIGGAKTSHLRAFGWFDDIADLVLIIGTLIALAIVIHRAGLMGWAFAIPAAVIIGREVVVGLFKGFEFSQHGWPSTKGLWLKNALTFTAVCALVAAPWLTGFVDSFTATDATLMDIYGSNSTAVWFTAQGLLWLAAAVSLVTGIALLRTPKAPIDV